MTQTYDDASWHTEGKFPQGSPEEYGGTHIALFLKWCFVRGWAGEEPLEDFADDIQSLVDGNMSATDYLFRNNDGKLVDYDLNAEGQAFAGLYYGRDGLYLSDYADKFGDLMYVAPESAHDFVAFAAMMETRFQSGILTNSQTSVFHRLKKHFFR